MAPSMEIAYQGQRWNKYECGLYRKANGNELSDFHISGLFLISICNGKLVHL